MITPEKMHAHVYRYILDLNCPSKYNGFWYLRDGVNRVLENPCEVGCLRKNVYLAIAEKYRTDICNVERSTRTLVDRWWTLTHCGGLFDKKPTNAEVFNTLAARISLEISEEAE